MKMQKKCISMSLRTQRQLEVLASDEKTSVSGFIRSIAEKLHNLKYGTPEPVERRMANVTVK